MNRNELIERTVRLAKKQILDDIASGIVPASVSSFAELHDYTDANMYGSLDDGTFELPVGEELDHFANEVQNQLDEWIKTRSATIDRSDWLRVDDPRGITVWLNLRHPYFQLARTLGIDLVDLTFDVVGDLLATGKSVERWNVDNPSMAYAEVTK